MNEVTLERTMTLEDGSEIREAVCIRSDTERPEALLEHARRVLDEIWADRNVVRGFVPG